MSLIVREYEQANDREQTADLYAQVYRSGEPMPPEEPIEEENESRYVASVDGRIVGAFTVCHMATRLDANSQPVPCGGLAAVAVSPEARRAGVGAEMVGWSLARMKADGYALSHLYAFRESWYRRLGWEVCGRRFKIACPQHRLPDLDSDVPVRDVPGEDAWRVIEPVYLEFAKRYSGMNLRTPRQWRGVTRGTKNLSRLYAIGDPAEAYCVVHVNTPFWEEQHVSETAWSSRAGYEGLLAFFRSIASNKSGLTWFEPSDSAFIGRFMDQGVKVSLERPIMYRVLDVPAALSALKPEGRGEVTILIEDRDMPGNAGPWRVSFCEDCVEVEVADSAEIEIDIGHLSQAAMGEPSFAYLLNHGLARCASDSAAAAAASLFRPRQVYCMDFF